MKDSLKVKIILPITLTVIIMIICFLWTAISISSSSIGEATNNKGNAITKIVSANLVASLLFEDTEGIENTLKSLKNDPDIVGAQVMTLDRKNLSNFGKTKELTEKLSFKKGIIVEETKIDNILYERFTVPIKENEASNPLGYLSLMISKDRLNNSISSIRFYLLLVSFISLVIVIGLSYFMIARALKPLVIATDVMEEISTGEGDLTVEIDVTTKDEIGKLTDNFNQFITKIRDIISDVKLTTLSVSTIAESVKELSLVTKDNLNAQSVSVEQTSASILSISGSANDISSAASVQSKSAAQMVKNIEIIINESDQMLSTTKNMYDFMTKTNDVIQGTIGSIENISTSIEGNNEGLNNVIGNLSNLNDNINQVSAAIEEMAVSITEVSQNIDDATILANKSNDSSKEGLNIVENTINSMNNISNKVNDTSIVIDQLKQSSIAIGKVVSVIDDIAAQTNLLALNAAIEAARAGEAGKGFAVVADEIRKLAEKTTSSTTLITDSVKSIQQETDAAVTSMNAGKKEVTVGVSLVSKAGNSLKEITENINQMTSLMYVINSSAREQSTTAGTISNLVIEMSNASSDSVTEASRQQEDSIKLLSDAKEARSLALEIDTDEMIHSVDEVIKQVNSSNLSIKDISVTVEELNKQSIEITNHSEAQSAGTSEIILAMESVSESSNISLEKAEELNNLSDELAKDSVHLQEKVQLFKTDKDEVKKI